MAKISHSFTDKNGLHWTACSECDRGGNGRSQNKCSCGWQVKRFNKMGCFNGTEISEEAVA